MVQKTQDFAEPDKQPTDTVRAHVDTSVNAQGDSPSPNVPAGLPSQPADEFERLKSQYKTALRSGDDRTIEDWIELYPQWSDEIRSVFPAIALMETMDRSVSPCPADQRKISGYEIRREIGCGGAGSVYEAVDLSTGNAVAVKVFHAHGSMLAERHATEAAVMSRLEHPNIVPVLDFGEEQGVSFLVMKLIQGVSLNEILNGTDATLEVPILNDLDSLAMIGADAASALSYAHEEGVLHRDIKPANLIVDFDGTIWLTDFGCAKHESPDAPATRSGFVVGTLKYMAPEHRQGKATEQSDIYSLGLTLRELLDRIDRSSTTDARYNALKSILDRACNERIRKRPATAADLEQQLFEFVCAGVNRHAASSTQKQYWLIPAAIIFFVAAFLLGRNFGVASVAVSDKVEQHSPVTHWQFDPDTKLGQQVITITNSYDDVEEYGQGTMYCSSSDLELVWDEEDQIVGLRFEDLKVPPNARITKTYIQFQCAEADIGTTNLVLRGIRQPNPRNFTDRDYDLSSRPLTVSSVAWAPQPWKYGDAGEDQQTPDLSVILHELIQQDSWKTGNAVAFSITGAGCRCAVSSDRDIDAAPQLYVEYSLQDVEN